MFSLKCPVCGLPLIAFEQALRCPTGHSFDRASEGYVNLLTGNHTASTGDNKMMSRARHDFLSNGYYSHFAEGICEALAPYYKGKESFSFIDAGCGEGFYTDALFKAVDSPEKYALGADLSKSAVRLAAKRNRDIDFCVASVFSLPVFERSADAVLSVFAPVAASENLRVLKPGGILCVVSPGKHHLWELKSKIYDTPYDNPEAPETPDGFRIESSIKLSKKILLRTTTDIKNLFLMTPYAYKTSPADAAKLDHLESLRTETEFLITIYKPCN